MKTKIERITININKDVKLVKRINSISYYSVEQFISDGFRYIKAIKEHRMINSIGSVSSSGMSRTIKFVEISKGKTRYNMLNFWCFFKALGYVEARSRDGYFSISGCGMDMIFHTNYTNIGTLCYYGFIDKKESEVLRQDAPNTI